ncbi:MAG: sensor histidine kinase [Bacteroidia bacterium]
MNRTNIIFISLSVYIIFAFAWWTYAHIRDNNAVYLSKKNIIELECYKATVDINGDIQEELFSDTTELKQYFYHNYPDLEIIFDTEKPNPFDNYLIRPKKETYLDIDKNMSRKVWMYTTEGIVLVLLLFWGIILIYRTLHNQIMLKRQQNNFLHSITHELKTPLASIKLYLETMRKRKLDSAQTETIIHNSLNDVERLHELVENLLFAAQLDNHRYEPVIKEINFTELVNETVDKFAHPRDLQKKFIKNIEDEIYYSVDENAMIIVLNNLLSNATKYSPPKSVIGIDMHQDSEKVILSVSNEGPSIPAETKKKLFTEFFRAGDENTRRTKGTGLGLFIVKNLLNLHHASIFVKDKQPEGTIFEIHFKK